MANETNKLSLDGVDYLLEDHRISSIVDAFYPVGSIYMSVNNANPGTLFGGTWERIQDTFLLAAGQTYSAGATGGESEHTLTQNEMPSHAHPPLNSGDWGIAEYRNVIGESGVWKFDLTNTGGGLLLGAYDNGNTYLALQSSTGSTGGGAAHNNMPPYLAVYVWKRTA